MKFSFCIPVCNEIDELPGLIEHILENKQEQDEIIVLYDSENGTQIVREYLKNFTTNFTNFSWYSAHLNKDFASFKNNFLKYATGDIIVQIDADESPSIAFWDYLSTLFESPRGLADAFYIARRNIVKSITKEHIRKWGWQTQEIEGNELINYPDWQFRIFKNDGNIKWKNKVHETLEGYKSLSYIPEELFLWHHKDIKRQEKQNALYEQI